MGSLHLSSSRTNLLLAMTKTEKAQEINRINELNRRLFKLDMDIKGAAQGGQIRLLEKERVEVETELMVHYGTEKYGLIHKN